MLDSRPISRTATGLQERRWRSQLAQLVSQHGFMRGTLQDRDRVGGKEVAQHLYLEDKP